MKNLKDTECDYNVPARGVSISTLNLTGGPPVFEFPAPGQIPEICDIRQGVNTVCIKPRVFNGSLMRSAVYAHWNRISICAKLIEFESLGAYASRTDKRS